MAKRRQLTNQQRFALANYIAQHRDETELTIDEWCARGAEVVGGEITQGTMRVALQQMDVTWIKRRNITLARHDRVAELARVVRNLVDNLEREDTNYYLSTHDKQLLKFCTNCGPYPDNGKQE